MVGAPRDERALPRLPPDARKRALGGTGGVVVMPPHLAHLLGDHCEVGLGDVARFQEADGLRPQG
eukprot:10009843-Heterocapsa_arctica.AAC.1